MTAAAFPLRGAVLLIPAQPSANDLSLAGFLTKELSDRWDVQLSTRREAARPAQGRVIVMGTFQNPLVREACRRAHLDVSAANPGPEGYFLRVEPDLILIAGSDERGAFYGLQSLRQLIGDGSSGPAAKGVNVRDWPLKSFRGIKLYLPGHANIPFFKRFVRDFMALYKFNNLIIEMNAGMRLDRHPELNAGSVEMARDTNFSRRNYPPSPAHDLRQNSSHQDVADGEVLEKSEVADLTNWVRANYIDVIPEIPSLTHSYYLLARHKDLAEMPDHKWPDTFCPLNPDSYKLLFDVLDEYIEVMKPHMIHIGHDEWFTPIDECPRCKGKDHGELYGEDVKKTHDYLAAKGIRLAMWGDMLLQGARGNEPQPVAAASGYKYRIPGGMKPEQVLKLVPKDILVFNWFWIDLKDKPGSAEANEAMLEKFGFQQIYGNLETRLPNYDQRIRRASIIGGAPSAWAATTEFNFGKDLINNFSGSSTMLWNARHMDPRALSDLVQERMPEIRRRLSGQVPPSDTDAVDPLNISPAFNMGPREPVFGVDLSGTRHGELKSGRMDFDLKDSGPKDAVVVGADGKEGKNPLPREVNDIPIGVDATSLIFLHATALPAANKLAYRLIWDFDDTADMPGWYEVVYEDGFVQVVPIRYGVNILEWNWRQQKPGVIGGSNCYGADVVDLGGKPGAPVTFFAYEWKNPRLGKVIRSVRLKGTTGFRGSVPNFQNVFGDVIPNNAVILKAISYVKAR